MARKWTLFCLVVGVLLVVGARVGAGEETAPEAGAPAGEAAGAAAKADDASPGCGCGAASRKNIVDKDSTSEESTETEGCKSTGGDEVGDDSEEVDVKEASEKYSEDANAAEPKELPRTNQMVYVQGGLFKMGSDTPKIQMDGEGPARPVTVSSFWMDVHEVSNAEFELFVKENNFKTEAETFQNSFVLDALISDEVKLTINQMVAQAPWWLPVDDADWRHPYGPDTDLTNLMDHPVTHVSWNDAMEFCRWADKRLPTEAEWEYACRNGKVDRLHPWGNAEVPKGEHRMNIWQGEFPDENTKEDGYKATAPVMEYRNQTDSGLKNMVGNVWEWTSDWWVTSHPRKHQADPTGPSKGEDKVKKGGSYMCKKSYCYRYRCESRSQNTPDSSASNLGFRCAGDRLPEYLRHGTANMVPST